MFKIYVPRFLCYWIGDDVRIVLPEPLDPPRVLAEVDVGGAVEVRQPLGRQLHLVHRQSVCGVARLGPAQPRKVLHYEVWLVCVHVGKDDIAHRRYHHRPLVIFRHLPEFRNQVGGEYNFLLLASGQFEEFRQDWILGWKFAHPVTFCGIPRVELHVYSENKY